MRTRFFRPIATMLSLLLVAVPAQAGPIKFVDVVNVMGDLQKGGQLQRLRLRSTTQDPATSGTSSSTSQSSTSAVAPAIDGNVGSTTSTVAGADVVAPGLMSGTEVAPTPTPPIPEPASLLLFGSGIVALTAGARARRRYTKMRARKQAETMTEV